MNILATIAVRPPVVMPDILKKAPEAIKGIFASGITTGGLTAIIANIFIRVKEDKEDETQ